MNIEDPFRGTQREKSVLQKSVYFPKMEICGTPPPKRTFWRGPTSRKRERFDSKSFVSKNQGVLHKFGVFCTQSRDFPP